jgi:DNA-binding CsgD family transcriptional regulator
MVKRGNRLLRHYRNTEKVTCLIDRSNFTWNSNSAERWNSSISVSHSAEGVALDSGVFEQWLDNDRPDRVLVDRNGKVLWCRVSQKGEFDGISHADVLAKVRVGATLPSDLLLPILNAGSLADSGGTRLALIEDHERCLSLIGHVIALGKPKVGPLGVTIATYRGLSDMIRADLKRIWDLSVGEVRILAMTFQGLTVQDISTQADISIDTVRTHIRHIYAKVGVSSREGLFAALSPAIG